MQYVNLETGEIIRLASYRQTQARAYRRNRTVSQARKQAHFPRAIAALSGCVVLASLVAFVAISY